MLIWIFYATTAQMIWIVWRVPLPTSPVAALDPFRIANRYGLFAVMTRGRYEIEFQGSNDGQNWTAYPFRYKPQDPGQRPGIYAPYQPRFDWNLWFASLGAWRENMIVPSTEERLLAGSPDVLALFAGNPFPAGATAAGSRRAMAILVHHAGREANHRNVVAASTNRAVCSGAGATSGRQSWGCAMAGAAAATVVTLCWANASYPILAALKVWWQGRKQASCYGSPSQIRNDIA